MNHKELFNLLKTVKKNIHCPQCGKEYDFSQIQIRGIVEYIVFLELGCKGHMPVMATVSLSEKYNPNESMSGSIDSNDVIETFKFLEKFPGGFDKIFKNS